MYGWMGKILHVDLSNSRISDFSTKPYAERYLGGRGIASRLYWETVAAEVKAFDPENHLFFMTGPLVATGTQGASRLAVVGKSPMAYPEGYCYGNIGGFFGSSLKKAGYDGVVITGRASTPVYLWICDNKAEICDATSLWGKGANQAAGMLQKILGEDISYLTTGVAGEKLVRTAVIIASHNSVSTGGFGAVMGSKNLKALAVRGTGTPAVAERHRLVELNRYTLKASTRFKESISPQIRASNHAHLLEIVGKGGCYQCGLECPRRLFRYGKRLEAYRKCQSMEYYLPWKYSREDEPLETFFDAPSLADDYSIGTYELQHVIEWLYDCYQKGCLSEKETGLPLSEIGTRKFLDRLLHSIAYREDFGDLLAEGLARAKERVSEEARALVSPLLAPIGQYDVMPVRAIVAHALLYSMEPRKHPISVHEIIYALLPWRANQGNPASSPISSKVFRDIAKAFWGSEQAADLSAYEGKALATKKIQNRTYVRDSLGLCDFIYPVTYSFNVAGYVGDPDLEAKLFSAVTAIPSNEIDHYAERLFTMQRAILIREGRQTPGDDFPPEYNFTDPLPKAHGRPVQVPGSGDEPVDTTGKVLDKGQFITMLREYYRLRGWDEETGFPRSDTLYVLGLEDLKSCFQR